MGQGWHCTYPQVPPGVVVTGLSVSRCHLLSVCQSVCCQCDCRWRVDSFVVSTGIRVLFADTMFISFNTVWVLQYVDYCLSVEVI